MGLDTAPPQSGGEIDQIKARYARRDGQIAEAPRRLLDEFALLATHERRWSLLKALHRRFGDRDARTLTVLDVGCGGGGSLLQFIDFGFEPGNMVGIELTTDRADQARRRLPASVRVIEGDATTADFPAANFDVVHQSTVFTSILDDATQQHLARRMWELARPGGMIVWYDFVYDNPRNKDVRGVPLARVHALFPDGVLHARRVTLAPPIGRPAARLSKSLYGALSSVTLLRSHVFVTVEKNPTCGKNPALAL